ncbi:carbohydrate-binding protein [Chitinophaga filiformis]|uniref:carbohydrate-binding protein n=1 Tax=Chitinophaga filiformis TaxID=104663 RepID=UPI001F3C47B9|nr:carbohydrate-binding protein [Chitinophaga filiformis]MCF6404373.1 carbohydrate-binding protein [Chitinophaga filiformis]
MLRHLKQKRVGVLLITAITFLLPAISFAQVKVACIGASVAAGYGVAPSEAYPSQVGLILGSNWNVGNFGESGSTLLVKADFPYVQRPNYPLALGFNPNIVTIELGSNDSKPNNWALKADFIDDYSRLIDTFRSLPSHPVIYICLPIPAYSGNFGLDNRVISEEIIPLVRIIAAQKNVHLIDLNTPLQNHPDWYQSDGIHPNATGARRIAEVIAAELAAPTDLRATVISKNQINLNWTDRTNETNFRIQRSVDSTTWTDIATVPANTTSYQNVSLTATTKYYYRVSATISIGTSVYSNTVSARTSAGPLIPAITSGGSATTTAGVAFQYTITATNSPQSYNATGLPEGLSINAQTGVISGSSLSSGVFNVTISATNTDGTASKNLLLTVNIPAAQLPYNGSPLAIPGKIEAEEYDKGGQGIAYNDTDASNNGGLFRPSEGVDLEACSEGGYDQGYTFAGEWAKYTVNVTEPGTYTLQARVAAPGVGGLFHVELDGVNISGPFVVPNTNGYQTWGTATVITPVLPTGKHVLRVIIDAGGFNINYLNFSVNKPVIQHADTVKGVVVLPFTDTLKASFNPTSFGASGLPPGLNINTSTGLITGTPTQAGNFSTTLSATNISGTGNKTVIFAIQGGTPFKGIPISLPGKLEAEDYDLGGQNIAYNDFDANNHSGQYRPNEGVDVEGCGEGGYDVGGMSAGEWISYSVNVTQPGTYTLQARVASPNLQKSFHVELNGKNISGAINVPNTGDWQVYQTVNVTTPVLTTGRQTLRIIMDTDGFNLNYLNFVSNDNPQAGFSLPGRIEAEDYDTMFGIQLEGTGDVNGSQDVGFIDANDWMDYKVTVQTAGTYKFNYRVASPGGGQLQLRAGTNTLATVNIPSTGGWQTWQTLSANVNLSAGNQVLRIFAGTGGWNINWFEATQDSSNKAATLALTPVTNTDKDIAVNIYPNPTAGVLTVDLSELKARGKGTYIVYNKVTGLQFTVPAYNNVLDVSNLPSGVYVISFNVNQKRVQKTFVKL